MSSLACNFFLTPGCTSQRFFVFREVVTLIPITTAPIGLSEKIGVGDEIAAEAYVDI